MDGLKELVKRLEKTYDEEEQIQVLQSICRTILNEYVIDIQGEIIEPLRVEAYYYPFNEPEKFNDPCAHKSEKKIRNYGKVYFIEERYGYPGIDICLSLGDYYLSFLVKNSRVGENYHKQMDLYDRFVDRRDEIETQDVLKKVENNKKIVFNTARVGISKSKTKFAKEPLAALIEMESNGNYTFERGFGKGKAVIEYISNHENIFASNEQKIEFARKYAGYCP